MSSVSTDSLIGSRLAHYRCCARIGSGAMGTVYRARDEHLQRDVAVKILAESAGGDVRRSLVDEARILSRLNHPNIAVLYDMNRAAGHDFLVLEYVPGLTLEELLASGPLRQEEVAALGAQMARGLAAAHAEGVIHGDVKPANIKVTPSGQLKLLDFGVAQLARDSHSPLPETTGETLVGPRGTVPFMSPEQLRGDPLDKRSDIFSAGGVLYHMATGRPPFPQRQLASLIDAVLNVNPIRPSAINRAIRDPLEGIVLRALRKRPARRYQSGADLAAALDAALQQMTNTTRLHKPARRWWHRIGAPRAHGYRRACKEPANRSTMPDTAAINEK